MSNTEIPHAEDFAQELAMLIETYQERGLPSYTIISILFDTCSDLDEDEE